MNISSKIEEIRRKPEHIRVRYVWLFVFISMLFVIILWVFSLKDSFPNESETSTEAGLSTTGIINEFGQQKKSLDATSQNLDSAFSNQSTPETLQNETQNNSLNNPNNASQ